MLTMKKRLLAAMILGALALAQILPVAANNVNMTYGSCSATGTSLALYDYSLSATSGETDCYHYVQFNWYDSILGDYVHESAVQGYTSYVSDLVYFYTPVYGYHRVGYGPGTWTGLYYTSDY